MARRKLAVDEATLALRARFLARPHVLDGAIGTELERRGVPTPAPLWSAAALRTHPEVVASIHREYAAAGADILTTCTFRTNPAAVVAAVRRRRGRSAGQNPANACKAIWRTAAELAHAAASGVEPHRDVLVATSIGPVADCYDPAATPQSDVLKREHRLRSRSAGDLVLAETMGTIREAVAIAGLCRAARRPFIISFILNERGELLGGEALTDAIADVRPFEPVGFGLNCMPPTGIARFLPRLKALARDLPIAVYAHIGNERPLPGWGIAESPSPEEYAAWAREWLAAGANIVGGCCGTTPEYIREVVFAVRQHHVHAAESGNRAARRRGIRQRGR